MIRPARDDEARCLAEIHVPAWCAACHGILPADLLARMNAGRQEKRWAQWLRSPGSWTFVREHDGRPVGFATLGALRVNGRPSRSLVELRRLYVAVERWRCGFGRELLEHVLAIARERGHAQLVLWVLTRNQRARDFYAAHDFEPGETRRISIGGHGVDEIRYGRHLTSL